jgi:hypothetical protein
VTWFGLAGHAIVGSDDRHVAWAGPVVLPHYGVVNRLLRPPDGSEERLMLVGLHERGHFETLPLAALLVFWHCRSRRHAPPNLPSLLVDFAAVHLVWEGLAEGWLIGRKDVAYRRPPLARMLTFWLLVAAAVARLSAQAVDRQPPGPL